MKKRETNPSKFKNTDNRAWYIPGLMPPDLYPRVFRNWGGGAMAMGELTGNTERV